MKRVFSDSLIREAADNYKFRKGPYGPNRETRPFADLLGGIYNESEFSNELANVTLSCDDLYNLTKAKVVEPAPKPRADIHDLD